MTFKSKINASPTINNIFHLNWLKQTSHITSFSAYFNTLNCTCQWLLAKSSNPLNLKTFQTILKLILKEANKSGCQIPASKMCLRPPSVLNDLLNQSTVNFEAKLSNTSMPRNFVYKYIQRKTEKHVTIIVTQPIWVSKPSFSNPVNSWKVEAKSLMGQQQLRPKAMHRQKRRITFPVVL